MLSLYLSDKMWSALRACPDIAPALSEDGAVHISFTGGIFEPGGVTLRVPKGTEELATVALIEMANRETVPLFVGFAPKGQPAALNQLRARVRLAEIQTSPCRVQASFSLQMGT